MKSSAWSLAFALVTFGCPGNQPASSPPATPAAPAALAVATTEPAPPSPPMLACGQQQAGAGRAHYGSVWSLAVSPDGSLLVSGASDSGSADGPLKLWSLSDGSLVKRLHGHRDRVGALAITSDGRVLASGGADNTVRLWSLPDGRPLGILDDETGPIDRLAVSPDGRLLASASGRVVKLWQLPGGRLLATLAGHTGPVHKLAITPDGRTLVSTSYLSPDGWKLSDPAYDRCVRLWSLPDGRPIETLAGRTGPIVDVALSSDGGLLAATGPEGTHVWSLPAGHRAATFTTDALAIAFAPDGRWLVALDAKRQARLWRFPEATEAGSFEIHAASGNLLALPNDGRTLVTGSRLGGPIEAWAVPEGQLLGTLDGHRDSVWVMAAQPDRRRLVTADSKGIVNLWDLDGFCLLRSLDDPGISRGSVAVDTRVR